VASCHYQCFIWCKVHSSVIFCNKQKEVVHKWRHINFNFFVYPSSCLISTNNKGDKKEFITLCLINYNYFLFVTSKKSFFWKQSEKFLWNRERFARMSLLSIAIAYKHTHTHTHTHTFTLFLSLYHTHTHIQIHILSHSHTHLTHTPHTHTHKFIFSFTHTHAHAHSLSYTYTQSERKKFVFQRVSGNKKFI